MKIDFETLYRRIGLLLYAEASRHRHLTMSDFEMLKNIVATTWVTESDLPLQKHLTDCLLAGITEAYRQSMRTGEARQLFHVYYANHRRGFSDPLKTKVVSCFGNVAQAFAPDKNGTVDVDQLMLMLRTEAEA